MYRYSVGEVSWTKKCMAINLRISEVGLNLSDAVSLLWVHSVQLMLYERTEVFHTSFNRGNWTNHDLLIPDYTWTDFNEHFSVKLYVYTRTVHIRLSRFLRYRDIIFNANCLFIYIFLFCSYNAWYTWLVSLQNTSSFELVVLPGPSILYCNDALRAQCTKQ